MEEDEEELEVKYIDQEDFENLLDDSPSGELVFRWIDNFETKERKWYRLLDKLISPLAGRSGYCQRITKKYTLALNAHGAETVMPDGSFYYAIREMASRCCEEAGSLPLILRDCSDITKMVNQANFVATTINKIGLNAKTEENSKTSMATEDELRLSTLFLYHEGYRKGLELQLANHRHLRHFRGKNVIIGSHVFSLAPQACLLALQMVLEDWNCPIQDQKIPQLVHAHTLLMRDHRVRGDGVYVLNEALCCSIALALPVVQEEIEHFDELLTGPTTNLEASRRLMLWKSVSHYERAGREANPRGFLVSAQKLEEECRTDELIAECTVMVETACKIRRRCERQEDELIELITDTVTRCPALGPRMLRLAQNCDIGYEAPELLRQMCDSDAVLHPSELTWLTFIEIQTATIGKFGSAREMLENGVRVMFEFLDFDANRFNEKAWFLMKKMLELTDPSFVVPEWEIRRDWWPRFHRAPARNRRKMGKKAARVKEEVLEALEELIY